jgi:hydroxymethylpyrimidine/phosphomethylpyrimidine kinase
MRKKTLPIALTVAGSDSGGGAGIQADLKTFASLKTHGVSAITCLTAQNPKGVLGVHACPPGMVSLQLEAIFAELPPKAAKTGMLFSAQIIEAVVEFFGTHRMCLLVVDPVMVATSGAPLLKPSALRLIKTKLLPLACLITPNLDEASLLTGRQLRSITDLRSAAKELHERYGCGALVKGGHLRGSQAVDVFFDGKAEALLSAPFVKGVSTHGTGCTYSAAIAASLAKRQPLQKAVESAKDYITNAISRSHAAGPHSVLNCFHNYF